MTSSAITPSIHTALTALSLVLHMCAPALRSLDHVIQRLDEFVDIPAVSSLPKATANGSLRWFNHVYERTMGNYPHHIESSEDVLAQYFLSNAMKAAVEHGHMAIVQRIHSLHPKRLDGRLLPIAARKGNLEMFQWLFTHRTDDLCVPDGPSSVTAAALPSTKSIASLSCCLKDPYDQAIRHDQLHIAMWLLTNGFQPPKHMRTTVGDAAAARGDLDMVQWLHTNAIPYSFTKSAIDLATKHGHRHVVEYLLSNRSDGFNVRGVHYAVLGGYDDIHELLRLSGVLPEEKFENLSHWAPDAAKHGRLDLLESDRRYSKAPQYCTLDSAWDHGHLHVVQWMCKNTRGRPNVRLAATNGHLHILQWLHDHPEETLVAPDWTEVMDSAARGGHLHVVQWLHETRGDTPELCTYNAMDDAAMNGHLAIVQWLHENRKEGCTTDAMDLAAASGHWQVVQWLRSDRNEGCTVDAMSGAAAMGHLEMVIWLHKHRTEGYRPEEDALQYPPLSVLKWLHYNRHEGWPTAFMLNFAAMVGDLATLQFLQERRSTTEGCTAIAVRCAAGDGHLYPVQWLHKNYPKVFDPEYVATKARASDHHHIGQWLQDKQLIPSN